MMSHIGCPRMASGDGYLQTNRHASAVTRTFLFCLGLR